MTNEKKLSNGSSATIFSPDSQVIPNYILYFHGGGLIYGSRNDLPEVLKNIFLSNGYSIIALDYRLAPNSSLKEIRDALIETFYEISADFLADHEFSFCGRSAGSYLMLLLTKKLLSEKQDLPRKLINFYGYSDLAYLSDQKNFSVNKVPQNAIQSISLKEPIWDDPYMQRYLLYVYGSQHQLLPDFYGINESDSPDFSLSNKEIELLPPIFSTASTADQEIPFKYSKQLAKKNAHGSFAPVYYLEHDFLSQTEDSQVKTVMKKLDQWLKTNRN